MLLCTVRDCRLPLTREDRRVVCPRGHSFDIARSGYINLLQPQDKKSKHPGDTVAAIEGRRRLHDLGVTRPLLDAIAQVIAASPNDIALDAGCGEGFYLGSLAEQSGCAAHGVDISIPAIDAAAKRYNKDEWIVANADRFIPYADATFTIVLSITSRLNAAEFRRVLRDHGRLLVAIPSPDDLVELRGSGRDRTAAVIEAFADKFQLMAQHRATASVDLEAASIEDLRHSIYRPLNAEPAAAMRVTFSLDLLLFTPRLFI
jgi:23S rRNA (guanine745-N1)-methyltransferase